MLNLSQVLADPDAAQNTNSKSNPKPNLKENLISVEILGLDGKGEESMKKNSENITTIGALNNKEAPEQERLDWLHEQAPLEIQAGLEPFGYYHAQVAGSLTKVAKNWQAKYTVTKGEVVKIGLVNIRIEGSGSEDRVLMRTLKQSKLKTGSSLNHTDYEKTKDDLQERAQARGYFESFFLTNTVIVDIDKNNADIDLDFKTGPRYKLGSVKFEGSVFNDEFMQSFVKFTEGDPHNDEALLGLQGDLVASDYFDDVLIDAQPEIGNYITPIGVNLSMRKKRLYGAGLGFGTDTGARVRGMTEWRWLNEWGHTLKIDALLAQRKQLANITYSVPGKMPLQDRHDFYFRLEGENTSSQKDKTLKDYSTAALGFSSERIRGSMTHKHSLEYRYDRFNNADEDKIHTLLLIPSFSLLWKSRENLRFSQSGLRIYGIVRGSSKAALSDVNFIQAQGEIKAFLPFNNEHRLISRIEAGSTWMPNNEDFKGLPPSLRFYAGGDNSVRGYSLDNIGPRDNKNRVIGGKHLLITSLEYEYKFKKDMAVATFIDAGNAFNDHHWNPKLGIGVGGRWYSPIGSVRLDIAHGLDKHIGDKFRFHLSIGADL